MSLVLARRVSLWRRRADSHRRAGRLSEACRLARRALAAAEGLKDDAVVGECAHDLGIVLFEQGQVQASRSRHLQALRALEGRGIAEAVVLGSLSDVEVARGDLAMARLHLERSVALWRETAEPGHTALPRDLARLAFVVDGLGERSGAISLLREAIAEQHRSMGEGCVEAARLEVGLAAWLQDVDPDEAERLAQGAFVVLERVLGRDHPDTATAQARLGLVVLEQDPSRAVTLLAQSLVVLRANLPEGHVRIGYAEDHLGWAYRESGQLVEAERCHREAISILEEAREEGHPDLGVAMNSLATTLIELGRLEEAEAVLRRVLAIEQSHSEATSSVDTKHNLGHVLHERGHYSEAREVLEEVLEARVATVGEDHPDTLRAASNLGMLLYQLGDAERARPYLERALTGWAARLGDDHPRVAIALENLAGVEYALGHVARARAQLERSLEIREALLGVGHMEVGRVLDSLAEVLWAQGKPERSHALQARSLTIREAAYGPDHPSVGLGLNHLAAACLRMGDARGAELAIRRARDILEAELNAGEPRFAPVLLNSAQISWESGEAAHASAFACRAAWILDGYRKRVLPILSVAERRAFVDHELTPTIGAVLSLTGSREFEDGYAAIAGWKGMVLDGLRSQPLSQGSQPQSPLADMRRALAHAVWHGDEVQARALEIEREKLERSHSRSEGVPMEERASLAALQQALGPREAFADVYLHRDWAGSAESTYTAVVVTPHEVHRVRLGSAAALMDTVSTWRARAGAPEATLDGVRERLWAPIAQALTADVETIWVAGDRGLHSVPWGVVGSRPSLEVMGVSSGRALARLLVRPPSSGKRVVVVGDIDYGTGTRYGPLQYGAIEVQEVCRRAEAWGGTVVDAMGTDARPSHVLSLLPGADIVHIATHGRFGVSTTADHGDTRWGGVLARLNHPATALHRSPLVSGTLALTGANEGPQGELTAEELVGAPLQGVSLLVASACESGVGEVVDGQGALGVAAVFEAAGVRTVISSLWRVPDGPTSALMDAFYDNLWHRGLSVSAALRAAQERVRKEWPAPWCWAGWVVSGDGRLRWP